MKKLLAFTGAVLAITGAAYGQGADDCSNAQVIAGLGPHAFDNTAATNDGPADCEGKPARRDVWFEWTAPQTGGYVLTTCGLTALSTRIVVYDDQPCPVSTAPVGCAAGGCASGIQTLFSFPTSAGSTYLIRVGSRNIGESGSGTFELKFDNCWNLGDDNLEENDDCSQVPVLGSGSYPSLHVKKTDPDLYAFDVQNGDTLQVDIFFTHATGDLDMFMYDACGGGTQLALSGSASDDESMSWTNDTGSCVRAYVTVLHWAPDLHAECNDYSMTISGASTPGTCGPVGCGETPYCDTNPDNQARIHITDCDCALSSIEISMTDAPAPDGNFGYVLVGASMGSVTNPPGAVGDLCLIGSPIGRYNKPGDLRIITGGVAPPLDILNADSGGGGGGIPTIGGNLCSPAGQSWNFQWWHRDGMNPSKFSDAIAVTFH